MVKEANIFMLVILETYLLLRPELVRGNCKLKYKKGTDDFPQTHCLKAKIEKNHFLSSTQRWSLMMDLQENHLGRAFLP